MKGVYYARACAGADLFGGACRGEFCDLRASAGMTGLCAGVVLFRLECALARLHAEAALMRSGGAFLTS
jgi:hypothetical protein